ncbi:hypothetical protein ACLOJK_009868 [Asimina triloba]
MAYDMGNGCGPINLVNLVGYYAKGDRRLLEALWTVGHGSGWGRMVLDGVMGGAVIAGCKGQWRLLWASARDGRRLDGGSWSAICAGSRRWRTEADLLAVAAGSLLAVDGLDVAGWIGLWPWASMGWAMVAGPMEKPDDGDGADRCWTDSADGGRFAARRRRAAWPLAAAGVGEDGGRLLGKMEYHTMDQLRQIWQFGAHSLKYGGFVLYLQCAHAFFSSDVIFGVQLETFSLQIRILAKGHSDGTHGSRSLLVLLEVSSIFMSKLTHLNLPPGVANFPTSEGGGTKTQKGFTKIEIQDYIFKTTSFFQKDFNCKPNNFISNVEGRTQYRKQLIPKSTASSPHLHLRNFISSISSALKLIPTKINYKYYIGEKESARVREKSPDAGGIERRRKSREESSKRVRTSDAAMRIWEEEVANGASGRCRTEKCFVDDCQQRPPTDAGGREREGEGKGCGVDDRRDREGEPETITGEGEGRPAKERREREERRGEGEVDARDTRRETTINMLSLTRCRLGCNSVRVPSLYRFDHRFGSDNIAPAIQRTPYLHPSQTLVDAFTPASSRSSSSHCLSLPSPILPLLLGSASVVFDSDQINVVFALMSTTCSGQIASVISHPLFFLYSTLLPSRTPNISSFHRIKIQLPSSSPPLRIHRPNPAVVMVAKREEEMEEIGSKSTEDINEEIIDLKAELFMLRLQKPACGEFKSSEFSRMRKRV